MQEKVGFKYLTLLAILIVTIMQISSLVAYKPVLLGDILLPGGVIGFPLVFTISDVISEVYGYKRARRILWESVASCIFFAIVITSIINLPSPPSWHFQAAYDVVFGHLFRIISAVIIGISISAFVNIYLITKWKIFLKGKYFFIRCFFSSSIGEAMVTLIADIIAFLGTLPFEQFVHLVLSVYIIKLIYSFIAAVPANFAVTFLKKYEKIDVYDKQTNFNPFSLEL